MIMRAQISIPFDSALPRDVVTMNPHYVGDNAQGIADALAANIKANALAGATCPFTIKMYDAQKAPPSYPLATATNGSGFINSGAPREVALCLSYYSTWNRPQYRGRIYIPVSFFGGALGLRPTTTQRTNVGLWANVFGKNLPAQQVWAIYSQKRGAADAVNNWWVDDEWDTMRSRGLSATTRQTAKI